MQLLFIILNNKKIILQYAIHQSERKKKIFRKKHVYFEFHNVNFSKKNKKKLHRSQIFIEPLTFLCSSNI